MSLSLLQKRCCSIQKEKPAVLRTEIAPPVATQLIAPSVGPTATLRFHVVEEGTNRSLSGVGLSIWLRWSGESEGITDSNGVWSVEFPISQRRIAVNLSLYGDSRDYRHTEDIDLAAGEVVERTFVVPKRYLFTLVILAPDGNPVAHANVRVRNSSEDTGFDMLLQYTTDESGTVEIPYMVGRVHISSQDVPEGAFGFQAGLDLTVADNGGSQILTFYRSHDVLFLVQDQDQNNIEGFSTQFFWKSKEVEHGWLSPHDGGALEELKADADGELHLPLPVIEKEVEVIVKHPEYSLVFAKVAPGQTEVLVTLPDARGLRGRVMDESGQAVVGAEVRGWSGTGLFDCEPGGGSGWTMTTTTGRDGGFQLPSFDAKHEAWLFIQADGFAYFGQRWRPLPTTPQEVVLSPPAPLFGFLVDGDGDAVADAWVQISGRPAFGQVTPWQSLSYYAGTYRQFTGKDGGFAFPSIAAGEYQLKADHGAVETLASFHTGPNPIYLTLGQLDPGLFAVVFQVLDAETYQPISGAAIMNWEGLRPGVMVGKGQGETDSQGECRIRPLMQNDTYFVVSKNGYVPQGVFTTIFGDGVSERQLLLRRSVVRDIQLEAEDGQPLVPEGASLSLVAGVLLQDGFMLTLSGARLHPSPSRGVGKHGNAEVRKSGSITFRYFPAEGATLTIETLRAFGEHGEVIPGPTLDIDIPAGSGEITLILTMAQLRALGLRD